MNIDNANNWDPQALGLVPMVVEQSGRANARTTSIRAC
jgi:ATP-dependent Clp protease protease subunit